MCFYLSTYKNKTYLIWMSINFNSVIPPKWKHILLVFSLSCWGISGTEGPGALSQVIYFWWSQVSHSESIALQTICTTTASPERKMELHCSSTSWGTAGKCDYNYPWVSPPQVSYTLLKFQIGLDGHWLPFYHGYNWNVHY